MDNYVLMTTWHSFKAMSLVKFLTDDNNRDSRFKRQQG